MRRKLFFATAVAAIAACGGTAWAQNGNNPAPAYPSSASAAPSTDAAPIADKNNPAPVYPSSASTAPRTDAAPIVDGNNPAPKYGATSPAPAKTTRHASKQSSHKMAHSKHHKAPRNG